MCHGLASRHDLRDFQMGLRLAVPPALSLVFLCLVVEGVDLRALALPDDLAADLCPLDERGAHFDLVAVHHRQDLAKLDLSPNLALELLDDQDVVFLGAKLLASGFDDYVHGCSKKSAPSARKEMMAHRGHFFQLSASLAGLLRIPIGNHVEQPYLIQMPEPGSRA